MAAVNEENSGSDCKSLIQEGDQVVLKADKAIKVVQVRRNRKVFFEKFHFNIDSVINCPFGSEFEVKGDKLNLTKPCEDAEELKAASAENGEKSSYQPIQSDGNSQKLTKEDVNALKSEGVGGQKIVEQLIENSATFNDRTEFSKEKYRKKKHKKYNARITILKPSTLLIANMYYSKTANKICELRPDALSQLLSLANIRANSNVIVVEQCQGLVVGAILDRMGGHGSIVQIHSGDFPTRLAMECFGFSSAFMETVNAFPLFKVNSLKEPSQQEQDTIPLQTVRDVKEEQNETKTEETKHQVLESTPKCSDEPPEVTKKELEKINRRNKRQLEESKARDLLQTKSMDSLVVVCKFHPGDIVLELLEYVAPSRPFVIFSTFKEPLVECYSDLRNRGGVVNLQLTETWWRQYQVLPGRTHPLVNMNGSGGYLLSGTTVERFPKSDTATVVEQAEVKAKRGSSEEKTSASSTLEDESGEPPAKKVKENS